MRQNLPPVERTADRLRICFISETLHSGVGRHIADTICALSERGHEIHLLYSPLRLETHFLAAIADRTRAHCEAIPIPRSVGTRDISAFARIRKYIHANGPFDIIHGHSSKGGAYARLLKLFCSGSVFYSPHAFITRSP